MIKPPKLNFNWSLIITRGIPVISVLSAIVFYWLKGDFIFSLIFGVGLFLISYFSFFLIQKKDTDVSKYDTTTNLIKNILEMIAILLVGITTYQSTWFEDFFYHKNVEIKGTIWEHTNDYKKPIYDPIHFQCKLIDETGNKRDLAFTFISKNGELQNNIKVHKDYQLARFSVISPKYGFYNYIKKDSIDVTTNHKDSIPFNQILILDPLLYKKDGNTQGIADANPID